MDLWSGLNENAEFTAVFRLVVHPRDCYHTANADACALYVDVSTRALEALKLCLLLLHVLEQDGQAIIELWNSVTLELVI